jgi:hypothetical protein
LHTATLLPSGKVLVVGGFGSATLVTAEVYDEAIGAWTAAGSLATARYSHTATSLPSGKVLVAGGHIDSGIPVASAELYDERTGTWTTTGSLATPREYHAATRLRSGKVLVAGGRGSGIVNAVSLASAELYDEAMGAWTPTGSLANARHYHTTTLLRSGKVLVAGGYDLSTFSSLASAELYDETGIWTLTGSLFTERHYHTATLVPSGEVLVAGGFSSFLWPDGYLATAELYDEATGTWAETIQLFTARDLHAATLLRSGKVLVTGGFNARAIASAEWWQ